MLDKKVKAIIARIKKLEARVTKLKGKEKVPSRKAAKRTVKSKTG
ncbi:MAG: hypothetical protein QMC83_07500 [Thermodesulfovibrionales bacterium]|nr:hypothetical protein [Thermodesulfovibrionales bacterium]